MTIGKLCFVIMPFGEKTDAAGKPVNFDAIYRELIERSIEGENVACPGYTVDCVRCDDKDVAESGWIHRKMIQWIHAADVAVVDLSTLNPNVFYELGVRHALVPAGTVLIRREGTALPFNITGFNTITYPKLNASKAAITDFREQLRHLVCNALTVGPKDSLVHEAIDVEIRTKSPPIRKTEKVDYRLRGSESKSVGLITGDLVNVRGIDAWVNSENTNMQMDRYVGGSISSVIRYFAAGKDRAGFVVKDHVAEELASVMGDRQAVNPGSVLVTGAGDLTRRNGVKRVFHVASVVGQVRVGFRPAADLAVCVERVLEEAGSPASRRVGIRSILFPLMGTGTARGDLEKRARELIGAAVTYLINNPDSPLDRVYFLNWSKDERKACESILQQNTDLEPPGSRLKPAKTASPAKKGGGKRS